MFQHVRAGAEIDRVEHGKLRRGHRHRIIDGAGTDDQIAGLDTAERGRGKRRNVAARDDVQHVRAAPEIDRTEAAELRRSHRHRIDAAARGERLHVGDRAGGQVDGAGARQHERVGSAAAVDQLVGREFAIGNVDRVVAAARHDRIGAKPPCDRVIEAAAGKRIGTTIARQLDRHGRCACIHILEFDDVRRVASTTLIR
jgi:hypothetical protein